MNQSYSCKWGLKKVENPHSIMKKNALAFLNQPTEKVFPASEVSKNILDKVC